MAEDPTQAPAIAFAGGTLDRAAHLREDGPARRLRQLQTSKAVLVGSEQTVALNNAETLARVPIPALADYAPLTLLGLDSAGAALFAYDALEALGDRIPGEELTFAPLRQLAAELESAEAALAGYAVAMVLWHRVNRHCGRCGHTTEVHAAGHRRRCPGCRLEHFPRTDPAVTMLVQAGERCLLSRRHGAPEHRWSALAGFVEPGETPELAVVREAREETGVKVAAVEYVAAQPWPFPSALMLGYWAFAEPHAVDEALKPQAGELVDARWFDRVSLAAARADGSIDLPPPGTIGNYLISTWLSRG
jgi:NAD+ diphosphatase